MMTTAAGEGSALVLTQNRWLRLATLFILYFVQGMPIGTFLYAIPVWMAEGGTSVAEVAVVVSAFTLPFSFKLVNGFIIDRYTLPRKSQQSLMRKPLTRPCRIEETGGAAAIRSPRHFAAA